MKRLLFILITFVVLILSCGKGSGSGSVESLPKEITPQDKGVSFYQIVWMFSGVLQSQDYTPKQTGGVYSGTGYFLVDTSELGLSGFVQVVTEKGWVVQNLPVAKDSSYTKLGINFRLADTAEHAPINTIQAYVLVTPEPLTEAPNVTQFSEWVVQPKEYNAEGKEDPVTQIPEPSSVSDTFTQGSPSFFISTKENWPYSDVFNKKFSDALIPKFIAPPSKYFNYCLQKNPLKYNIQAANNQCGPAAATNSLYWLKDTLKNTYNMDIPHKNGKGLGNVNGNGQHDGSLVGAFDVYMGRSNIKNRKKGGTLPDRNFIEGKLKYLTDNKICLVVKHQDDEMKGDVSAGRLTSKGNGVVTWEWVCKEVCKGQDVELGYTYPSGGGHWVKVTGCGHVLGS